jgi:chemotaxis protein methyltransferase CheR
VGDLTTKETYLFRDPKQLDCLNDALLPDLVAQARSEGRKLRIWSAGCSTGEEGYSVAMMLAEMGATDATVIATDLSEAAIARARQGDATDMRLAPDARRWAPVVKRWIQDSESGPVIADEVRALVRFTVHNAVRDEPPAGQDLILCRNVMIYLPPAEQRALVGRLWDALRPDGLLLLGEAELLHVMPHSFEHMPCERAIIYRRPRMT